MPVLISQSEVYYYEDRLLIVLTTQKSGTTARWNLNKIPLFWFTIFALHCKDRLPVFMPLEAMLVFSPFILQLLYVKCRIETRSKKYFYLHSSGLSCRRQKKKYHDIRLWQFFFVMKDVICLSIFFTFTQKPLGGQNEKLMWVPFLNFENSKFWFFWQSIHHYAHVILDESSKN